MYPLPIEAHIGEWWRGRVTVSQPASWTGWTGKAQIRHYRGAVTLLVELDVDLATDGLVVVTMPDGATDALEPFAGEWDLWVYPPGGGAGQCLVADVVNITGRVTVPA